MKLKDKTNESIFYGKKMFFYWWKLFLWILISWFLYIKTPYFIGLIYSFYLVVGLYFVDFHIENYQQKFDYEYDSLMILAF